MYGGAVSLKLLKQGLTAFKWVLNVLLALVLLLLFVLSGWYSWETKKASDFIDTSPAGIDLSQISDDPPIRAEKILAKAMNFKLRDNRPIVCSALVELPRFLALATFSSREEFWRPSHSYYHLNSLALDMQKGRDHIQHAFLQCRLETKFSDVQLIRRWSKLVYLGEQDYGIETAAHNLFGRSFDALNDVEVLQLAAIAQSPSMRERPELLEKKVDAMRSLLEPN